MSRENDISRRKALSATAGISGALVGVPIATADGDGERGTADYADDSMRSVYGTNDDGYVVLDNADFDEWEVLVADRVDDPGTEIRPSQIPDDVSIYVGKYRNARPPSGEPVQHGIEPTQETVTPGYTPDTYFTLASGTFPEFSTPAGTYGGWTWAIEGGIEWNITALEVDINISAAIGASSITLWSVTVSHGERGICVSTSPSNVPAEISGCLDVTLGSGELAIGGSVDICVPDPDPCPVVDCKRCLGGVGITPVSFSTPW